MEETGYLRGKDIAQIFQQVIMELKSLERAEIPLRGINISVINEGELAKLVMHFMLETILCAKMLAINPFNQPSVERGKKMSKEMLKKYFSLAFYSL